LILKLSLSSQLPTCTESRDIGLTDCLILKPNEVTQSRDLGLNRSRALKNRQAYQLFGEEPWKMVDGLNEALAA